jgi:hypothetical protein
MSSDEEGWAVIRERELEALAGAEMPALAEAAPAMPLMAVAEPLELAEDVPRRLRGKQAAPAWYTAPRPTAAEDAVAAEAWAELVGLSEDAQRQHVHYTHIRTTSPTDRQPSTFTRAGFWSHLEQVYRDVYPEAANSSGSILLFGAVAKEQHAAAKDEELRAEHHHTPAYCSKRHLWRIVAKQSHEVYNVKLHAAAHEGYSSMYSYICCPSSKKPLAELDAEVFLSEAHPRGDLLRRLLEAGAAHQRTFAARVQSLTSTGGRGKRERAPDFYELVRSKGFKSVPALLVHAHEEASAGRVALAEYCTRQGHKLKSLLANAWAVVDAPARMALQSMTLLDKLKNAASLAECVCAGTWAPGAISILERNGIAADLFASAVRRALELGARRMVNIACVGEGGCGKSSLIEVLEHIFNAMPKPQRGSTFAFADLAEYDILLWQDYEHHEETVCFTDVLSVFVGESFGVRSAGVKNEKVRNKAPVFYSGRTQIQSRHRDAEARAQFNGMMDERFTLFRFTVPIPMQDRRVDWPQCAKCAARFYLEGCAENLRSLEPPRVPLPIASEHSLVSALVELAGLKAAGHLDDQEFRAAKRRLLQ